MIAQVQKYKVSEKPWLSYTITENVRQQWVYIMQACGAIHCVKTSLTGKHHITNYSACEVLRGNASA